MKHPARLTRDVCCDKGFEWGPFHGTGGGVEDQPLAYAAVGKVRVAHEAVEHGVAIGIGPVEVEAQRFAFERQLQWRGQDAGGYFRGLTWVLR